MVVFCCCHRALRAILSHTSPQLEACLEALWISCDLQDAFITKPQHALRRFGTPLYVQKGKVSQMKRQVHRKCVCRCVQDVLIWMCWAAFLSGCERVLGLEFGPDS